MDDLSTGSGPLEQPALRNRLSTRIVASALVALLLVLGMIAWTLWLSWQLEGAGAAINDAGSLRMRANRIGLELLQPRASHATQAQLQMQRETLNRLESGVPARPLFIPNVPEIRQQMQKVEQIWNEQLRPVAINSIQSESLEHYLQMLPTFVAETDKLVQMIEVDNASKINLLRLSQAVLLGVAFFGALATIYLLYLWIIAPILHMQDGLRRMAEHEFGVRLQVETRDEFGVLAQGFNHMADELETLYRELENRVFQKTSQLAEQNRELAALYEIASFLNLSNGIDALCRGFLQRVMQQFKADAGSIRVLDPLGENLHLVVSEGLPEALRDSEHCMKVGACLCGRASQQGVVIQDFRKLPQYLNLRCVQDGFNCLAVFKVVTQDAVLGTFSLHFRAPWQAPASEAKLLETLGQLLGVALENRRLSAQARQLAVAQERNLVAQGLHDSIAQGLNFLNLQLQMLESALKNNDLNQVNRIVPLLHTGVDESYQDVRELLLNFRSKLGQGDLMVAIEDTLARFLRQTSIEVNLQTENPDGAPLPPEQQLQVLFILQEALSNVRKHANASRVDVFIRNSRDFELLVRDNGQGYKLDEISRRSEKQIGLQIMKERAARLNAQLILDGRIGQGASVKLVLPCDDRQSA